MITFLGWWLVASVICAGINYLLMRDSEYEDDA